MERGPPSRRPDWRRPHRGRAAAAERLDRRIVQPESVLAAIRDCEVGVIENVEELGAELEAIGFARMKIFCYEKSKFRKPVSGNMFRPMLPKWPRGGAIITELPAA